MSKRVQMNFEGLVTAIRQVHERMAAQANKVVNISLTLRNWAIGCYIREYEQNGADRAQYGEQLLSSLSQRLEDADVAGTAARSLRLYRQFYLAYPEIWQSVTAKSLQGSLPKAIWQTLSAKFGNSIPTTIPKPLSSESTDTVLPPNRGAASPDLYIPTERLVTSLSFSHFAELIPIEEPLKRGFYEVECIRGNWSVRELKRQIATLYFERSGLSKNKKKLSALVQSSAEVAEPKLAIRDPYIFEFLGIKPVIMAQWIVNLGTSRIISALRDLLLPKLMAGEACLRDMIKYMENISNAFAS